MDIGEEIASAISSPLYYYILYTGRYKVKKINMFILAAIFAAIFVFASFAVNVSAFSVKTYELTVSATKRPPQSPTFTPCLPGDCVPFDPTVAPTKRPPESPVPTSGFIEQ